jgi:hypothetical protein
MKKNYTYLLALLLFFSVTVNAQGPWNFNGTNEGFVASSFSSITTPQPGDTYITYNINTGAINPNLDKTSAGIDTSNKYIAITMQNNTANTKLQVITNRSTAAKFTNFEGVIANDTGFTTYYIDMTSNSGWTGTVNEITFRFKLNSATNNPVKGTVLIDKIEIVASVPTITIERTDYTFDNVNDNEGMVGLNATLSHAVAGEVQIEFTNQTYPGIKLENTYHVPSANNLIAVTFNNISNANQIAVKVEGPDNQFESSTIVSGSQTVT